MSARSRAFPWWGSRTPPKMEFLAYPSGGDGYEIRVRSWMAPWAYEAIGLDYLNRDDTE